MDGLRCGAEGWYNLFFFSSFVGTFPLLELLCVASTYLQEVQVLNLTAPFPPQMLESMKRPCLFRIWSCSSQAADIY